MSRVAVAVIGCGDISRIYLQNIKRRYANLSVAGVYDNNAARARALAEEMELSRVYTSYEKLLDDDSVRIVLNLTPPLAHYEVTRQALCSGKHVYSEKPLATSFAPVKELAELAQRKGLLLACGPDTILGGGLRSCKQYLREGIIGEAMACSSFMLKRGMEDWHPNPAFLYTAGGGPLLDMGPYYLTALVDLLGPIHAAGGQSACPIPVRTIRSQPLAGRQIEVSVPTYVNGLLQFAGGVLGTITMTFDAHRSPLPYIELYGTLGTLSVPDPNTYGGPIILYRDGSEPATLPLLFDGTENLRGAGLSELATAMENGTKPVMDHTLALHVLEALEAIGESRQPHRLQTTL